MNDNANPLAATVQALLAPVPGAAPAGRWMRYERAFMETAKLREEDDLNLPMGEWERPMVKADWRKVAQACVGLLGEDTKDFQIAGWLVDAWIRTARMEGLSAGSALLAGLAENFWDEAWPAIDDGDTDRRVSPFVWLNTNLPLTLKLNIVLLPSALHRATAITLLDWERAATADDAKSVEGEVPTRREIRDSVKLADGDWLHALVSHAERALADLERLSRFLDEQLKQESPSLSKLTGTIDAIRLAAQSLLQELPAPVAAAPADATNGATNDSSGDGLTNAAQADAPSGSHAAAAALAGAGASHAANAANAAASAQQASTTISDRAQAYESLVALADYLQAVEPHSPTPYLIRRAVQLGQMGLPEMVREVTATAGSLDKFFELLGITPPN